MKKKKKKKSPFLVFFSLNSVTLTHFGIKQRSIIICAMQLSVFTTNSLLERLKKTTHTQFLDNSNQLF